jgi:hypothetical protein
MRRSRGPRRRTIGVSLLDLPVPEISSPLPSEVAEFLDEAERRVEGCKELSRLPGFVPSNYPQVYHSLRSIAFENTAAGDAFCEWGSGFGVVTCLAAFAGFRSIGIEIEPFLVEAARRLAADFHLDVQFLRDSYLPPESCDALDAAEPSLYVVAQPGEVQRTWGLTPEDFDLIYAYPGPDDDALIAAIFRRFACSGAILLTFHGREGMRLRRKIQRRRKSSRRIVTARR